MRSICVLFGEPLGKVCVVCVTSSPSHHFHHCIPWTHYTPWWEAGTPQVGIGVPCTVSYCLVVMIPAVPLLLEARECNSPLLYTHQVCLLLHIHSRCWSLHTVTSAHLFPADTKNTLNVQEFSIIGAKSHHQTYCIYPNVILEFSHEKWGSSCNSAHILFEHIPEHWR